MTDIGLRVSRAALNLFRGGEGLPKALSALSLASGMVMPPFQAGQVHAANISAELIEMSSAPNYPSVHIYCERVTNDLREKFRRFSGKVRIVAETRVSLTRLDDIESRSHLLAGAVTEVLDVSRGDWGNGMFYAGGYEVAYGPVKQGGKNFLQITKIAFDVDVSAD
jgi:hypothetical protein